MRCRVHNPCEGCGITFNVRIYRGFYGFSDREVPQNLRKAILTHLILPYSIGPRV